MIARVAQDWTFALKIHALCTKYGIDVAKIGMIDLSVAIFSSSGGDGGGSCCNARVAQGRAEDHEFD
jgi:hypothetical protein